MSALPPAVREQDVIAVLRRVYDPEIPLNIYDLGLVYGLEIGAAGDVHVRMTLTSPACPVAGRLPGEVEQKLRAVPGVRSTRVELVWDPPWTKDRLSEAARLALGLEDVERARKPFVSADFLRRPPR